MMFRCGGVALALALVCGARQADAGYCNGAIPCPTSLHAPGAIGDVTPGSIAGTTLTLTPAGNAKAIDIPSGYSLTGSDFSPGINLLGTWNTTGAPTALVVNIINTASDPTLTRVFTVATNGATLLGVGSDLTPSTVFIPGTNTSSVTTTQNALNLSESFNPGGASLTTANGILSQPNLSGSSITVGNFFAASAQLRTGAGYTGTVTRGANFRSQNPSIAGSNPITTFQGFSQEGITNGSGNTTGTITNQAINISTPTAVAASGGTMVNTGVAIALASGTNAGTATNTGLQITGNGQTGGGATNWAINSTSTAPSSFAGQIQSTVSTGTAPFTVASITRVANLNAATAGNADTVTTNANLTGVITSSGNATSIASQTGTGTKFVVDTSPTLADPILNGYHASTAQLDKTSNTTFASITGLTSNTLTSGATYVLRGRLSTTSGASGGIKVRISSAGALTVTSLDITARLYNGTTLAAIQNFTALGTTCAFTGVITDIYFEGSFVVNVAGSYLVQMAQNVSNSTTTSVFINSEVSVVRVN